MKPSLALAVSLTLGLLAVFLLRESDPAGMTLPARDQSAHTARTQRVVERRQDSPAMPGREQRSVSLPADVLDRAVEGDRFDLTLPDGSRATGTAARVRRDATGVLSIHGALDDPLAGRYYFQRQTADGVAGELAGHILFEDSPVGWKVLPAGPGGAPRLVESHVDRIVCVDYAAPPAGITEEVPQAHPTNIPIPSYQTVLPLQSLPGATGVIYLDFDGEPGPFEGWGDFDAAPATASNSQVFDVWRRVAEDFQGFSLNITTDRKVFDAAPPGRRQHVVITPTTTAAPTAGGVAYIGSFNWSQSTVCWAFYSTGKSAAEVISHEVGHTLDLSHDGRTSPSEGYYRGHGDGSTGWAPIMGVGYYENLTQWSKGEYLNANNGENDLAIIVSNNDVAYRADDAGDTLATARHLEIAANDSVSGEGIIERTGDIDAFRFATAGGAVALNLNPVSAGPNLDILAELLDASTGTVVATSNPDLAITASLSETLAAGEYLLRIRGTGRGDPEGNGYTDYGSLGSYLISGSVAGGVTPDRFIVAENAAAGEVVGSVAPRLDHGSSPLLWTVTGGNAGGAFAIDTATGELSVVSPRDFETLSSRWDDPADIELFVTISDPLAPSLDETIRVVVTVSDLNEPPTVSASALTMLERTRSGTLLLGLVADDPDRFQFPVFSIAAGNNDGWFAIDAGSGELRVAGDIEVAATTVVPVTVQVTDQGSPALSSTAIVSFTIVDIPAGYEPGGVMRTFFEGIGGTSVGNLTSNARFPDNPDSEAFLDDFDDGIHGENFGSTVRGYVIPPVTGSYRFWISSDDSSQLRLSTTASPSNASTIASVSGWTDPYSWPDSGGQQSSWFTLVAGQPYYIEARHKEGSSDDHIDVAWTGPGIPKQLLRGLYLAPYRQNYAPKVPAATLAIHEDAFAGQSVGTVDVTDVNAEDGHGGFTITAGNADGIFAIDPASGWIRVVATGLLDAAVRPIHTLTVGVTDTGSPARSGSGTITVRVLPPGSFASNAIFQQVWTDITGTGIAALTAHENYPFRPDQSRPLGGFETAANIGDNYGSRIRVLVVPPASGSYTFHLSSDDDSRLLLGSGPSPDGAVQIASVTGFAGRYEWNKFPSQSSEPVELVAGQPCYLEVLHKENGSNDHVQVGWSGPTGSAIAVIPASALRPYDLNEAPVFPSTVSLSVMEGSPAGTVVGSVSAVDPEGDDPLHAITASEVPGAFAIDPADGTLTLVDAGLGPGVKTLTVSAQDRGIGGLYPLKTASIAIAIEVISTNQAPAFSAEAFVMAATEDEEFSDVLTATDPDAGDLLVFTKIAGPEWLVVSPEGALSGSPGDHDTGPNEFTVQVSDPEGFSDEAALLIVVANVNDPPVFTADPIVLPGGTEEIAYAAPSLAGKAIDPDPDDPPAYSIVSGPGWLALAPDGTLSGTPPAGSAGTNLFTIRATDAGGLHDEAVVVIEVASTALPLPWEEFSIGPAGTGSSVSSPDGIAVTASGILSGRNDSFHFVWQPLGGDGSITARLDAMLDTGPDARAGVMIRDTLASNSRHVFLGMTGSGGYRWVRRTGFNGNTSTSTSGTGERPDAWVRLVRGGDTITAFKSSDGLTWITIGSLTAELPATCYFGLAVASGSPGVENAAVFSHVSLTP